MLFSKHMYCVAVTFKMTEQVEQWICIRFCVKLENSSMETIWMIQKAATMGNWWWVASSWQGTCSCIMFHAEVFRKTANHPGDSAPPQPRFGTLWLLAFPKTKITFERKVISDHGWDSGKYDRAAHGDSNKGFYRVFWTVEEILRELCEVPKHLLWRGLRCLYPMYNVSCILYFLQ